MSNIFDSFDNFTLEKQFMSYVPPAPNAFTHPLAFRKVTFGPTIVHYYSPPLQDTYQPLFGFGPLGTVGEMEAYEVMGTSDLKPSKKSLAPISASRLVQRRWRANKAKL